jgi:hypothetical protein
MPPVNKPNLNLLDPVAAASWRTYPVVFNSVVKAMGLAPFLNEQGRLESADRSLPDYSKITPQQFRQLILFSDDPFRKMLAVWVAQNQPGLFLPSQWTGRSIRTLSPQQRAASFEFIRMHFDQPTQIMEGWQKNAALSVYEELATQRTLKADAWNLEMGAVLAGLGGNPEVSFWKSAFQILVQAQNDDKILKEKLAAAAGKKGGSTTLKKVFPTWQKRRDYQRQIEKLQKRFPNLSILIRLSTQLSRQNEPLPVVVLTYRGASVQLDSFLSEEGASISFTTYLLEELSGKSDLLKKYVKNGIETLTMAVFLDLDDFLLLLKTPDFINERKADFTITRDKAGMFLDRLGKAPIRIGWPKSVPKDPFLYALVVRPQMELIFLQDSEDELWDGIKFEIVGTDPLA